MNGSSSAGPEVEYSPRQSVSAPSVCGEIPSGPGGGEPDARQAAYRPAFTDPDLQAALAEQHRDCRACHPERPVDWLRFATLLTVAGGSLALWIFATAWCVGRYS